MPRRRDHDADAYRAHADTTAARQRRLAAAGREIGPIPPIADPDRRRATSADLATFAKAYFPDTFYLPFSPAHTAVIASLQRAATHGGLFAVAMPRGYGKTSLTWTAALWALMTGARSMIALIGADEPAAASLLAAIKTALESNATLAGDWPEVCYPVQKLEGVHQRSAGQLHRGRPTALRWTSHEITLPTIAGSRASGATVRTAGLTGRIRGMQHVTKDGRTIRPSMAILDDPQTDESARSPSQCENRASVINGAVLNLSGPGTQIAAVMPCTVIRRHDLAHRLLDREISPQWQGQIHRAVETWPDAENLWAEYARLRTESLRADGDGREATDYYRTNRNTMDAGAVVTWPENYNHATELSAIQSLHNLRLRDPAAFSAEYQQDPIDDTETADALTRDDLRSRPAGFQRGTVPAGIVRLTAHVDVHDALLYWTLLATTDHDLSGFIIDYGTWPQQRRDYFTLRDATSTLRRKYPKTGKDGAIVAGIRDLLDTFTSREYETADGDTLRLDLALVDAGYKPEAVALAIRSSKHPAAASPSIGIPITAAQMPMSDWRKKPGDRRGHHWRSPRPASGKTRTIQFDANTWKSIAAGALATAPGDPGAILLPDGDHRLYIDHLCAEYPVATTGRGRTINQWTARPNMDNHFWDTAVGAIVAAAVRGGSPPGAEPTTRRRRRGQPRKLNL